MLVAVPLLKTLTAWECLGNTGENQIRHHGLANRGQWVGGGARNMEIFRIGLRGLREVPCSWAMELDQWRRVTGPDHISISQTVGGEVLHSPLNCLYRKFSLRPWFPNPVND